MKKKLSKTQAALIDKIASLYIATGKAKCGKAPILLLCIPISIPKPNLDEMAFSA